MGVETQRFLEFRFCGTPLTGFCENFAKVKVEIGRIRLELSGCAKLSDRF